ncbi:MAG: RNA-directed DNA polymerase [Muricauda sp.]|mgnify:CR=1 FL=1|nr:antiviral reverse transcriptase Drt3a [Allomuricauda sp.]MBA4745263.1 RNA-directed DNA polymerase [Allomuricauda sp.]
MLDQSFSKKNFRIIFDIENRKGFFVEDKFGFSSVRKLTNDIKVYGNLAKKYKKSGDERLTKFFNEVKEVTRKSRSEEVDNALEAISVKILESSFGIRLKQIKIPGGSDLYTIDNKAEYFFAIKQVQYNISRLYGVKQSNRHSIVDQLIKLLNNKFPKVVIRTDISSFYESIDHQSLSRIINQDNLLNPKSRKIVNSILRDYKKLSGSNNGIPRGIGVSAYLAELFMRKIDSIIKNTPSVSYYARYVDDIVIIFTPNPNNPNRSYLDEVKNIIEQNSTVKVNPTKTFSVEITDKKRHTFEFLGYQFIVQNGTVKTKLTTKKSQKLVSRINKSFNHYTHYSKVNEKEARKILVKRIRFLTGNTRLANNKSNILVGVYYSNSFLTELGDIRHLDNILNSNINRVPSASLKRRLKKYSFTKGFTEKRFSSFLASELKEIMNIWK